MRYLLSAIALDVIALALHVDYWDYLGWKDDFAKAAFTKRQHGYAQASNATTVYTPQMVIGGKDHVIGSKAMDVMDHIVAQRKHCVTAILSRHGPRSGNGMVKPRWLCRQQLWDLIRLL